MEAGLACPVSTTASRLPGLARAARLVLAALPALPCKDCGFRYDGASTLGVKVRPKVGG